MSKFFKELEFDLPESPAEPKPSEVVWDKVKLEKAFKQITQEVEKIKSGTSEYTTYAINPGSFGFPAINSVKIFVENPSDRAFKGIHDICKQDLGARAGDFFYRLLKSAREEK